MEVNMTVGEEVQKLFPDDSYESIVNLISKIQRFMPHDKRKVSNFEEVISYVYDLINGDMIHQYCTFERSLYAKEAFREIIEDVQKQTIASYRAEKESLQNDVQNLSSEKENLDTQVHILGETKRNLTSQAAVLNTELIQLQGQIKDLKENGSANAKKEVLEERQHLNEEISALQSRKEILSDNVNELSEMIENYKKMIANYKKNEPQESVVWEPIDNNHPIYSLSRETIGDYVKQLELMLCDAMGITRSEAQYYLMNNSSGLYTILYILTNKCIFEDCITIDYICQFCIYQIDAIKSTAANNILKILEKLKMPVFKTKSKNNFNVSQNNIQGLLREMEYQKSLTEAVMKQKLLETQLEYVIQILQDVVGPDFDFSKYTNNHEDLGLLLAKKTSI